MNNDNNIADRLRAAHPNSAQRWAGSNILLDAAGEIDRLTALVSALESRLSTEGRRPDDWMPIATIPPEQQVLLWEPIYGWLLGGMVFGRLQLKSSGNFWFDLPAEVNVTHWKALGPSGPDLGGYDNGGHTG